jgi:hypothetical protein
MKLIIKINREEYAGIADGQQRECIQVHHQFTIPSEACIYSINPGMSYDLIIRKTKTILQPPPYQTDCYSYQKTNRLSRSDCIDKCLLQIYETDCKCLPIHIPLWNTNANLNLSICDYQDYHTIYRCFQQEFTNICLERCKPDCIDR